MSLVEPGKKAPAFTLNDQDGKAHKLADYAGRPVVLYFYPKDDTPGCTKETCDFETVCPGSRPRRRRSLASAFSTKRARRLRRQIRRQLPSTGRHRSRRRGEVRRLAAEISYGRKFMGMVRTTYLIDADGKVARRWDNVKVDGHAGKC